MSSSRPLETSIEQHGNSYGQGVTGLITVAARTELAVPPYSGQIIVCSLFNDAFSVNQIM
jgi:hypothetical protein